MNWKPDPKLEAAKAQAVEDAKEAAAVLRRAEKSAAKPKSEQTLELEARMAKRRGAVDPEEAVVEEQEWAEETPEEVAARLVKEAATAVAKENKRIQRELDEQKRQEARTVKNAKAETDRKANATQKIGPPVMSEAQIKYADRQARAATQAADASA